MSLRLLLQGPVRKDGRFTMDVFWVLYLHLHEMFNCNAFQLPLSFLFFCEIEAFLRKISVWRNFLFPLESSYPDASAIFFTAVSTKRKSLMFGPQKFCFCAGADDNRSATVYFALITVQVGEL